MNDAFDDLLRAMKRATEALYNGFEPDNQSRVYLDACEAIRVAGLARPIEASQPAQDSVLADHNAGIAALQRDAARYRWLRENDMTAIYDEYISGNLNGRGVDPLDASIDAAMRNATHSEAPLSTREER